MLDADPRILEPLLAPCTARIQLGGRTIGSAFFVQAGAVVTCESVLDPLRWISSTPDLAVVRNDATYPVKGRHELASQVPEAGADLTGSDLAILRFEYRDGEHPCVLLKPDVREGDPLATFGYTANGEPVLITDLRVASIDEDTGVIRLEHAGQFATGMAGAPLLNRSTGAVCGVVRFREGFEPNAVRASLLDKLSSTLPVNNARFHQANPSWLNSIVDQVAPPAERPPAVSPGTPPISKMLIHLHEGENEEWWVTGYLDGEQIGSHAVDLNKVRLEVARVFRDWASREAAERSRVESEEEVRLLGTILARAVMGGPIEASFWEEYAKARERTDGWFEVTLRFERDHSNHVEDLIYLPWEYLCFEREDGADLFLAFDRAVSLTRTLAWPPGKSPARPARTNEGKPSDGLFVLLVAVKPPDCDETFVKRVDETIAVMRELEDELPQMTLRVLEAPDPLQLSDAIARTQLPGGQDFHVVHYVGAGKFRAGRDQLTMKQAGNVAYVDRSAFSPKLDGKPRLVVLQLCGSPKEDLPADLTAFAPELLERGVDAVLASQYPLMRSLVRPFTRQLYTKLAGAESIERAVQDARYAVYDNSQNSPSFVSLALFVRDLGTTILSTGHVPAARQARVTGFSIVTGRREQALARS